MLIQQILRILINGWKIIILGILIAGTVAVAISLNVTPLFQSEANFIIAPNDNLASSRDIVSAFSALDTLNIFTTYADIFVSKRVFDEALNASGLQGADLSDYRIQTEMNAESIILVLHVTGPDAEIATTLANEIGEQGILFINAYYSVFTIDFLDKATIPTEPVIPDIQLNVLIGSGIGLIGSILAVIVQKIIKTPLDQFIEMFAIDKESMAYTKRYLMHYLEEKAEGGESWPISLILVKLEGLEGVFDVLPKFSRKRILSHTVSTIRSQFRGNDLVGRWDTLVFAIVLPKTPENAVGYSVKRLLQSLVEPVIYGVGEKDQIGLELITGSGTCEKSGNYRKLIAIAEKELAKND